MIARTINFNVLQMKLLKDSEDSLPYKLLLLFLCVMNEAFEPIMIENVMVLDTAAHTISNSQK